MKAGYKIRYGIAALFLLLFLSAGALLFYAFQIEPYRMAVRPVSLPSPLSAPLKVVQISDIQISESYTTAHFQKIVDAVLALEPDLLIFTGDLYEHSGVFQDHHNLISQLSAMQATYGKFAVWGNRDYGSAPDPDYAAIVREGGFQPLCNSAASIDLGNGETLFVAGLDDALLGKPDITPILPQMPQDGTAYSILLTHEPDVAEKYADMGFDLILSGHSHGGQIRIPFLPPAKTTLAEKYTQGLYTLDGGTKLYVNTGIGTSRIPARFSVVPEVTVFLLHPEQG